MIIHEAEVSRFREEVILKARVEVNNPASPFPQYLWFKYPQRYEPFLSTRADPFLGTLILIAQSIGEDVECRGEVSPRLLYTMDEYTRLYQAWFPGLFRQVSVRAPRVVEPPPPRNPNQYAATFSGGTDSFFTIQQNLFPQDARSAWPIKYGLFIRGSADIPLIYKQKYEALRASYLQLFNELGLELVCASTNAMNFSALKMPMKPFLDAPLFGCGLGLGTLFAGLLISSSQTYQGYKMPGNGLLSTHLLATESFECVEFGCGTDRFEKSRRLADWEPAQRHLRVCLGYISENSEKVNCSECGKCTRMRLYLAIGGKLDKFTTFRTSWGLRDFWLWSRWMDYDFGYRRLAFKSALKHKKSFLPILLFFSMIGLPREFLKKYLSPRLLERIYEFTRLRDTNAIYAQPSIGELPEEVEGGTP